MSRSGLPWGRKPGLWVEDALCAQTDPEEFFPEKCGSVRAAKQVCRSCPVAAECLTHALVTDERYGIWGGLSWNERQSLLQEFTTKNGAEDDING